MSETLTVNAEDGRSYDFGARAKVRKISEILEGGTVVTKFVFRNGAVREHRTDPSSPLYAKAAAHGLDQKFGDEFAGLDDVEDCITAFEELAERLSRGEWSERRASEGVAGHNLLVQALVRISGKSPDAIKAHVNGLSKEVRGALMLQPRVAAEIVKIKAERAAAKGGEKSAATAEADAILASVVG